MRLLNVVPCHPIQAFDNEPSRFFFCDSEPSRAGEHAGGLVRLERTGPTRTSRCPCVDASSASPGGLRDGRFRGRGPVRPDPAARARWVGKRTAVIDSGASAFRIEAIERDGGSARVMRNREERPGMLSDPHLVARASKAGSARVRGIPAVPHSQRRFGVAARWGYACPGQPAPEFGVPRGRLGLPIRGSLGRSRGFGLPVNCRPSSRTRVRVHPFR